MAGTGSSAQFIQSLFAWPSGKRYQQRACLLFSVEALLLQNSRVCREKVQKSTSWQTEFHPLIFTFCHCNCVPQSKLSDPNQKHTFTHIISIFLYNPLKTITLSNSVVGLPRIAKILQIPVSSRQDCKFRPYQITTVICFCTSWPFCISLQHNL